MSVVLHDRLAPLRARATPRSRTPTLPPLAWLYFAAVTLTAALLALHGVLDRQAVEGDWLRFALLTGFASVAQLLSVHIDRNRVFHPAMVFVVAGILLLPPELVALMCVAQHGPEWLKERYPWYIQSFNIANYVVAALAAGAAASILGGTDGSELATLLAGLSACIVFVALNRGLLAAMLRLGRSQSLRETGLLAQDDVALELVLASMGIALAAFWLANPWLAPISLAPLVLIYYAQRSSLGLHRASETIQDQNEALEDANRLLIQRSTAAMESLSAAVDARDAYTAGHSRRVRAISLQIGEELGLGPEELETLASASLFHDIGKIAVPDAVLLKPGRLTDDEWSVMRSHAEEGARIIERLGFLHAAVPAIRHHHERVDGSGYPDGLRGGAIPIAARIIHVADAVDSMLTTRVYRSAQPREEALRELQRGTGRQFCAVCVAALERVLARDGDALSLPSDAAAETVAA